MYSVYLKCKSFLPEDPIFDSIYETLCYDAPVEDEAARIKCLALINSGDSITTLDNADKTPLVGLLAAWKGNFNLYQLACSDADLLWEKVAAYRSHIKQLQMKNYSYSELSEIMHYAALGSNLSIIDEIYARQPQLLRVAIQACQNRDLELETKLKERLPAPLINPNYIYLFIIGFLINLLVSMN